jgi:predicted nucleic acid-binding protein
MHKISHYYWDSCVFIARLKDEKDKNLDDLEQFLTEAREEKSRIYASSLILTEIIPRGFANEKINFDVIYNLLQELKSSFLLVEANADVMRLAGQLRNINYSKIATKGQSVTRSLSTPDAIHLASAIYLEEAFEVKLDAFHTFDKGKSKGSDEEVKPVPLIGFKTWCDNLNEQEYKLAEKVIKLSPKIPAHPSPRLLLS